MFWWKKKTHHATIPACVSIQMEAEGISKYPLLQMGVWKSFVFSPSTLVPSFGAFHVTRGRLLQFLLDGMDESLCTQVLQCSTPPNRNYSKKWLKVKKGGISNYFFRVSDPLILNICFVCASVCLQKHTNTQSQRQLSISKQLAQFCLLFLYISLSLALSPSIPSRLILLSADDRRYSSLIPPPLCICMESWACFLRPEIFPVSVTHGWAAH